MGVASRMQGKICGVRRRGVLPLRSMVWVSEEKGFGRLSAVESSGDWWWVLVGREGGGARGSSLPQSANKTHDY